jgi:preprotein translocase subunit SecA
MTGTALTEEAEFGKIYNLEVMPIPTNQPMVRKDAPDVIYKNKDAKYKAITEEVKELHKKGQPVLVGTISIENSEILSDFFKRNGIPHSVLNAKHHEKEAEIVAKAGQEKMVTIATNMAGRGTDIVLGDGVKDLGGLHIIGSERHESRRIDNQLRGRSGRQGDNGSSRFYVALDDDLMRLFGSDRIAKIMSTLGLPDDTPIEHALISRSIEKAQKKVEQYYFSIRKQILEYDDVLNKQRETIYNLRKQILKKAHLDDKLKEFIETTIAGILDQYFNPNEHEIKIETNLECLKELENVFNVQNLAQTINHFTRRVDIINHLKNEFINTFNTKKTPYPPQIWDEVMKEVLIMNLDRKWMDNLHNMDVLREGIGLRAWGQRDPLIEYKIEAYNLFKELMESVARESLEMIFKLTLVEEQPVKPVIEVAPTQMFYNKSANGAGNTIKKETQKVGRNDDCPCGSGKKYKKCCGI